MNLIDSHCHLFYKEIFEDLDNKIKIARLNDIKYMLTVSTSEDNFTENIDICNKYSNICCSVGIHPHDFAKGYSLEYIKSFLNNEKVVAIGEVGLDYHFEDATAPDDQQKLFRDMLSLSENTDLPYIIHARECYPDIFDIMAEYKIKNAVFHCYTDNLENAKKVLDLGYYISFSGILTFKNSFELRDILKYVPIDKVLIETDSPYLAPVPYRGKVNEPAYVREVAECAAKIKCLSLDDFSDKMNFNFFKLFSKAKFLLESEL